MFQFGEYQVTTIVTDEPWRTNCYLVRHLPSAEQVLIDPGDAAQRIAGAVLKEGGRPKKILITHAHHDHVCAVAVLHQRFGVPCYLHRADARLMRQAHTYALVFDGRQMEPFTASSLYADDEMSLEIGKRSIQIMYTPGHTRGSVCYYFGDFVFTGDTILYRHVGRTDTPGSDLKQLIASVGSLVKRLPGETVVFPGHGRPWTMQEASDWWRDVAVSPPQYKRFDGIPERGCYGGR